MEEECDVCMTRQYLYPLECPHRFCLQCIKGVCVSASSACPCCRAPFTESFKQSIFKTPARMRNIASKIDEKVANIFSTNGGWAWGYQSRGSASFWLFDEDTQQAIRAAEGAGNDVLRTTICGQVVTVDLSRRVQTNTITGVMRRIHKIAADDAKPMIRGVAGMPCSKTRLLQTTFSSM